MLKNILNRPLTNHDEAVMAVSSRSPGKLFLHCLLIFFFLLFFISSARAASRLYFTGLVELNGQTGKPDILLNWGSLEGNLPDEIESFNLYRKTDSGDFVHLAEIPNQINQDLGQFISSDWNSRRFTEVLDLLNDISASQDPPGPEIIGSNFEDFLTQILSEKSPAYNPLQKWLFSRFNHNISRGMGLGFLDRDISEGSHYTYMLTALTPGGESLPIGQTGAIDPATPTFLPPPEQFEQVLVGGCSLYQKNLDDLRIHFTWQLPSAPQDISLNILTYGYDIFWSEEAINPAAVDLNVEIPADLHPMNSKPIVIAGPAEATGSDNFLSRDDGSSHQAGPAWKRGQHYYYYIVRRDIGGHFSNLQAVIDTPVAVVDSQPPVTPWRVHTEEAMTPVVAGTSEPQLHLVWDQINPVNYVRYFAPDRAFCSVVDGQVCMAPSTEDCANNAGVRCVDTDAISYDIYRFSSEAEASGWGVDSDGDLWPDTIEETEATEPCDPDDFPTGEAPYQKIISIDYDDTDFQRQLNSSHIQMVFHDPELDPTQYDKVFFYKIIARDPAGNQGPASPPIRAVLRNRVQPVADGSLYVRECDHFSTSIDPEDTTYKEEGDLLTLVDLTGEAVRWTLSNHCLGFDQQSTVITELASGAMINSRAHIKAEMIDAAYCSDIPCGGGSFTVTFYNDRGISVVFPPPNRIQSSEGFFSMLDLCSSFSGTVTLDGTCVWSEVRAPNRVASGSVQVCAPLVEGQAARVYQKINGRMSPAANIEYNSGGDSCVEFTEGPGIVTSDLCLGVRIFSENHIGSAMHYLHCLEMEQVSGGALPPAPILEGIYSKETPEGDPYFDLHWAGLLEGQTSFVIVMNDGQQSRYTTVFPSAKNNSGQFSYQLNLMPEDLSRQWCVKARLISTDMKSSPWSEELCSSWQVAEPENIGWPAMDERLEQGEVRAVLLKEGTEPYARRPALILSKDLSFLMSISVCGGAYCIDTLQECDGSSICVERLPDSETGEIYEEPAIFENLQMCSYIQPLIKIKNFIVYRQETGEDFVQVSPLIPGFSCQSYSTFVVPPLGGPGTWHSYSKIRDPFYSFRKLSSSAIIGQTPEGANIDPAVATGPRMFYLDHYPSIAGMTVRYKIILFDPASGEPKKELTSNWLTL